MRLLLLLTVLFLASTSRATADETTSVAIFERSVAPSYVWGQNGLMLTPIADTLGPWNIAFSSSFLNAGHIQNDRVLDSKTSLVFDTNGFFEFGYTRKLLTFPETFERTPFASNIYHMKSKLVDLKKEYIPKFSLGVFAFNLTGSRAIRQDDMYADLFGVLQEDIKINDDHAARIHLGLENGVLGTQKTDAILFGGIDWVGWDKLTNVMIEVQGGSRRNQSAIINAGAAVNLWHIGQLGLGVFNLANVNTDRSRREFMLQFSVNAPMDRGYAYVKEKFFPDKAPAPTPTPAPIETPEVKKKTRETYTPLVVPDVPLVPNQNESPAWK